jgi:hypothetical protein
MNSLEILVDVRKTLTAMNEQLTPYSNKVQYQRYLDSLQHYKKILNTHLIRLITEVDDSIEKSNKILRGFAINDIQNIKDQIENGN